MEFALEQTRQRWTSGEKCLFGCGADHDPNDQDSGHTTDEAVTGGSVLVATAACPLSCAVPIRAAGLMGVCSFVSVYVVTITVP